MSLEVKFDELLGETLIDIEGQKGDNELVFITASGKKFVMYHEQDCCEQVDIDDIVGNLDDLLGLPISQAEEVNNVEEPGKDPGPYADGYTWTFYKLGNPKGSVTIKWYGTSNGYYSESVTFARLK